MKAFQFTYNHQTMSDSMVNHLFFNSEPFELLNFIKVRIFVSKKVLQEKFSSMKEYDSTIDVLFKNGFISEMDEDIKITDLGDEKLSLYKVFHEEESYEVLEKYFKKEIRENYHIIDKNISENFFRIINSNKNKISEILICSPWISLTDEQKSLLLKLHNNEKIRFTIITRKPVREHPNVIKTLQFFEDNFFDLRVFKSDLHTKLYVIRYNDPLENCVIFGSENLTNRNMYELGILVKDEVIVNKCWNYFDDLLSNTKKVGKR